MNANAPDAEGQGLLAFFADVDQAYVPRFRQWHNCEHMPERLGVPGFLIGRRYAALDARRMFLMSYETRDLGVLESEPYLALLNRPTPWTDESLHHFRQPLRNCYRSLSRYGGVPRQEAPYLATFRFEAPQPATHGLPAAAGWLEALAQAPEVLRARLYELDPGASNVQTTERKIYGVQANRQRYLAMIECASPQLWASPGWVERERALAAPLRPENCLTECERESWWLDFAVYPPRA
jgi:hypothetical protein